MRDWMKPHQTKPHTWILQVKAKPRASRSRIVGVSADGMCLEVALAAAPVDGEANIELIDFFSHLFLVRKRDVEILSGESSRHKRVVLHDVDSDLVLAKVGVVAS
jgi:uncharacterized protein (TIGR00251 family)